MNSKSKALLLLLCAVAVVAAAAFGTLAYLTDNDTNTNTFTVGKVGLKLDEAKVNTDGTPVADAARVQANEYHLLPGHTYTKDPTVTVDANSEKSYIRLIVSVESIEQLKAALPYVEGSVYYADLDGDGEVDDFALEKLLDNSWNYNQWHFESYTDVKGASMNVNGETVEPIYGVYEFRYYTTADGKSGPEQDGVLEPLFTKITVPGEIDNDHLANLRGIEINVTAHAIQAAGFADADAAWSAFDAQTSSNS